MKTTRRHKIAHSAVIRRTKPRKSEKAKRHKRKTHKRKSRNKVMRGGIHDDIKVYLIRKEPELKPKCFIVRGKAMFGFNPMYIFFDFNLSNEDSKQILEYLFQGLNIDIVYDKITFEKILSTLNDTFDRDHTEAKNYPPFKNFVMKLSGERNFTDKERKFLKTYYTLTSFYLHEDMDPFVLFSDIDRDSITKYFPVIKIDNEKQLINNLKDTIRTPYTFKELDKDRDNFSDRLEYSDINVGDVARFIETLEQKGYNIKVNDVTS